MPRNGRPKPPLTLTAQERAQLQEWALHGSSTPALAQRSRIVLGCAAGLDNKQVSAQENVSPPTVGKWRQRFVEFRLRGLADQPRSGRPRSISEEKVASVVAATLATAPEDGGRWSRATMAEHSGLSKSSVGRIWRATHIEPHTNAPGSDDEHAPTRQQSTDTKTLVLSLLGRFAHPDRLAFSSQTFITAMQRLGVTEYATRATLARMVVRGLLDRHARGRRTFFAATPTTSRGFEITTKRIFDEIPVQTGPDVQWTLLSFSIREDRREMRRILRTNLIWRGFGPVSRGLWLAPGRVEVESMMRDLRLNDQVRVFAVQASSPTDMGDMIDEVWDLGQKRAACETFLGRWNAAPPPECVGPLASLLLLCVEWSQLVRSLPRLPVALLPPDWPAMRAHEMFHSRYGELRPAALAQFTELAEVVSVDAGR